MYMFALYFIPVGVILGLNYRVFVLIPTLGFVVICLLCAILPYSDSNVTLINCIAMTVTGLNVGYILGSAVWLSRVETAATQRKCHRSIP